MFRLAESPKRVSVLLAQKSKTNYDSAQIGFQPSMPTSMAKYNDGNQFFHFVLPLAVPSGACTCKLPSCHRVSLHVHTLLHLDQFANALEVKSLTLDRAHFVFVLFEIPGR